LAWPVLRDRPTAGFALALASGIVGVVLIEQGKSAVEGEALIAGVSLIRPAVAAALFGAVCTAVVMLGLHRLRNIHSLAIVVHFSAVATVVCTSFAITTPLLLAGWPLDLSPLADPVTLLLLAAVGGL